MKKKFWILVIMCLFFVQSAFSLETVKKTSKIVIDHINGKIVALKGKE